MTHRLVAKLRNGAHLTSEDERALVMLAATTRSVPAHRDILSEGEEAHWLPLILDGWACRYKILENGKRQIISLFLPGDLCEPFGVLPRSSDCSLSAITPVTFSPVAPKAIAVAARDSQSLREALWWDLLLSCANEREHIVRLGRKTAAERTGHLICELYTRLNMVGLVHDMEFELPLTQMHLADMLGLSTVHMNRSLQDLRRLGLVTFHARRLRIHNLKDLRELSFFDGAYFHNNGELLVV